MKLKPPARLHFIAIGGSVMHALALDLHAQGFRVSGSDDAYFDPSKSRLAAAGLLPDQPGWFPGRITPDLDAVILGMHAKGDNPELKQAQELSLPILSFPELIGLHAQDKQRLVVAGSHGKTTITALCLHVLHKLGKQVDYLVGGSVKGLERGVRLTEDAPLLLAEGDEYLTSTLDPVPKFLHYHHHAALVTGIAWDHLNVFPTEKVYLDAFENLVKLTPPGGTMVLNEEDPKVAALAEHIPDGANVVCYRTPEYTTTDGHTILHRGGTDYPLRLFGAHNLSNLAGAMALLSLAGIKAEEFLTAAADFEGAGLRLQTLTESKTREVIRDFAHAPSKVTASVKAGKAKHPDRKLVACQELHTYSSLSPSFLPQYKGAMDAADIAIVGYDPKALAIKKLPEWDASRLPGDYGRPDLEVYTDGASLEARLRELAQDDATLLIMTSGSFWGIDIHQLAQDWVG